MPPKSFTVLYNSKTSQSVDVYLPLSSPSALEAKPVVIYFRKQLVAGLVLH